MLPGTVRQAVVARQRVREDAEVRGALHVVVAAEDVGAAAGYADVTERQLHRAVGARVVVADRVLRATHAPDDRARPVLGHCLGGELHLVFRNAGDVLDDVGRPLGDLGADFVHAVNALPDVFLVFPAVLENVPEDAPDDRHVAAGADTQELVGVRGGAREAWIDHDHLCAVFLAAQHVLHRDRVRFRGITADEEHRLAVVHVVVRVGHRAVAPGVGYAGNRRRMTDARLVVDVVRAPQGRELAEQVGLFVVELGRAQPVHRVRAGTLADVEHLVADLLDGLVPGDLGPLAAGELHRVFQPAFAVAVLAHRCALGAVAAHVERRIEVRFLSGPHAVLNFRHDAAAHGAVGADGLADVGLGVRVDVPRGFRAPDHRRWQGRRHGGAAEAQTGAAQEGAAVHGGTEHAARYTGRFGGGKVSLLDQLHR